MQEVCDMNQVWSLLVVVLHAHAELVKQMHHQLQWAHLLHFMQKCVFTSNHTVWTSVSYNGSISQSYTFPKVKHIPVVGISQNSYFPKFDNFPNVGKPQKWEIINMEHFLRHFQKLLALHKVGVKLLLKYITHAGSVWYEPSISLLVVVLFAHAELVKYCSYLQLHHQLQWAHLLHFMQKVCVHY